MKNPLQAFLATGLAIGALAVMMNVSGFADDVFAPTMPAPVQPYGDMNNADRISPQAGATTPQDMHMNHQQVTLYLYNPDYPPYPYLKNPKPPVRETGFWRAMDREMQATQHLMLTENLEEADYRVELKCAGLFKCSKLKVFIESPNRDVLSAFEMKGMTPMIGSAQAHVDRVAQQLTKEVHDKIVGLDEGKFGYTR